MLPGKMDIVGNPRIRIYAYEKCTPVSGITVGKRLLDWG